jgi:hypothetical protein
MMILLFDANVAQRPDSLRFRVDFSSEVILSVIWLSRRRQAGTPKHAYTLRKFFGWVEIEPASFFSTRIGESAATFNSAAGA